MLHITITDTDTKEKKFDMDIVDCMVGVEGLGKFCVFTDGDYKTIRRIMKNTQKVLKANTLATSCKFSCDNGDAIEL